MATESSHEISFPCFHTRQPAGDFFVGVMQWRDLCEIAHFDVRRVIQSERDIERYLGIQRPLNTRRVKELGDYVNYVDASFPSSIIIAVSGDCASYDHERREMTLSNIPRDSIEDSVLFRNIARVIDGQHRIAGLMEFRGDDFQVSVTILVDFDIAEQAHIFSTVNLSQTKVSKSLAYDLFELARTRSPQKTCHNVAVALDQNEKSPFYKRIKRLGVATTGRIGETLTQSTFVEGLLSHMTSDARKDRDLLLRGIKIKRANSDFLKRLPLRNMFIDDRDLDIALLIGNYFDAVRMRWPDAWAHNDKGLMLNKTNGFRALIRIFKPMYLQLAEPGMIVDTDEFLKVFEKSELVDDDFSVERFAPGTSGEALMFRTLEADLGLHL